MQEMNGIVKYLTTLIYPQEEINMSGLYYSNYRKSNQKCESQERMFPADEACSKYLDGTGYGDSCL
jgi:hypothetical protein